MEPVSAVFSIMAALPQCIQSAKQLYDLRERYKDASMLITAIYSESMVIAASLSQVQNLLQNDSLLRKPLLLETFDRALTGCRIVYGALEEEVRDLVEKAQRNDLKFKDRAKYLWKEDTFKELLTQIRGQQSALSLLIQGLQMESMSDIRKLVEDNSDKLDQVVKRSKTLRQTHPRIMVPESIFTHDSGATDVAEARSVVMSAQFEFDDQVVNSKAYQRAMARYTLNATDLAKFDLKNFEATETEVGDGESTEIGTIQGPQPRRNSLVAARSEQLVAQITSGSEIEDPMVLPKPTQDVPKSEVQSSEKVESMYDLDALERDMLPFMPQSSSKAPYLTPVRADSFDTMETKVDTTSPRPPLRSFSEGPPCVPEAMPPLPPRLSSRPQLRPQNSAMTLRKGWSEYESLSPPNHTNRTPLRPQTSAATLRTGWSESDGLNTMPRTSEPPSYTAYDPAQRIQSTSPYTAYNPTQHSQNTSRQPMRRPHQAPSQAPHVDLARKPINQGPRLTQNSSHVDLAQKGNNPGLRLAHTTSHTDLVSRPNNPRPRLTQRASHNDLASKSNSSGLRLAHKASHNDLASKLNSPGLRLAHQASHVDLAPKPASPGLRVPRPVFRSSEMHAVWLVLVEAERNFFERMTRLRKSFYDNVVRQWPALEPHLGIVLIGEKLAATNKKLLWLPMEQQLLESDQAVCDPTIFETWTTNIQRMFRGYCQALPHALGALRATQNSDSKFTPFVNTLGLSLAYFGKSWEDYLKLPIVELDLCIEKMQSFISIAAGINHMDANTEVQRLTRALEALSWLKSKSAAVLEQSQSQEDLQNLERRIHAPDADIMSRLKLRDASRRVRYQGVMTMKFKSKGPWYPVHVVLLDNFLFWGGLKPQKKGTVDKLVVSDEPIHVKELEILLPSDQLQFQKATMFDEVPRNSIQYILMIRRMEPNGKAHMLGSPTYQERKAWVFHLEAATGTKAEVE